jgi:hypothetical protein
MHRQMFSVPSPSGSFFFAYLLRYFHRFDYSLIFFWWFFGVFSLIRQLGPRQSTSFPFYALLWFWL